MQTVRRFFRQSCLLIYEHDFSSDNGPIPGLDWLPPLLGIAVLLLLLRLAVRGACRLCLLGILLLLALAAFPHRDLTLFALGGLAVWCLMPGRDPKEKRQDDNS